MKKRKEGDGINKMKKCRCQACGRKFISKAEKAKHKAEYPDKSCANIELKGGIENNMVFGKKKKNKEEVTKAPVEELGEIENEIDETSEEEEVKEEVVEESIEPIVEPLEEKPSEELPKLSIEEVTKILIAHDETIKRIIYHLRI